MENVYNALKSFDLDNIDKMRIHLENAKIEEECFEKIFYIMKQYCQENNIDIQSFTEFSEDLNYEYYKINVFKIPDNLLNMIYKFLCLHTKNKS